MGFFESKISLRSLSGLTSYESRVIVLSGTSMVLIQGIGLVNHLIVST